MSGSRSPPSPDPRGVSKATPVPRRPLRPSAGGTAACSDDAAEERHRTRAQDPALPNQASIDRARPEPLARDALIIAAVSSVDGQQDRSSTTCDGTSAAAPERLADL